MNTNQRLDAFICHASEDKKELARPLAEELVNYGLKIWYDEFSMRYGDSISASIDHGLAISDYGIVILSKKFFQKGWTKQELSALLSKQVRLNKRIILPIWHDLSEEEIAEYSPILADSFAAKSEEGIKSIAAKFYKQIRGIRTLYNFTSDPELKNNVSALSRSIKERESLIKETEDEILLVILTKIYLITKGYRNAYIHFYQFSESLCSNPEEVSRLEKFIEILTDQNFIASKAWGTISITHNGIKKVENLLENAYSKYASQIRNSISDIEKAEISEIQKLRYTILKLAHELSDQKKEKTVNLFKIGDPLDINREKLQRIYFYLQDEGLIDFYSLGGGFCCY